MGEDWIKYQCKSGQTLFTYNKETGEHHWPLGLPEGIEYRIICSRSADHKQVSTIATQTDDNGCNNRCISRCINADACHVSNISDATLPQQQLDISKDRSKMICEMQTIKLEPRDEEKEGQSLTEMVLPVVNQSNSEANSICDSIHGNDCNKNSLSNKYDQVIDQNIYEISEMLQNPAKRKCSTDVEMIANKTEGYATRDGSELSYRGSVQIQDNVHGIVDQCAGTRIDHNGSGYFDNDDDDNGISNNDHGLDINIGNATSASDDCTINEGSIIQPEDNISTLRVVHKHEDFKVIGITEQSEFPPEIADDNVDYTADQRADLHVDVSRRKETKTNECSVCKKLFKNKYLLERHSVVHTGEKKFQCSICKKTFSQKGYLVTHRRMHTGEKPYKCSYCKKCFACKSTLNKHIRIHSKEKPFECSFCGQEFGRKDIMNNHVLKIHAYKDTS